MRPYQPGAAYPEGNPVSQPLMTVAQTIKEDLGLRVATVDASNKVVLKPITIARDTRATGVSVGQRSVVKLRRRRARNFRAFYCFA